MRWAFWSLFSLGVAVFLYNAYPRSACERVLPYSVGQLDARFNVPQDAVRLAARKAAELWETETGHALFRYEPGAPFEIQLHYDERQQNSVEGRNRLSLLQTSGAEFDELHGRFNSLKLAFESRRDGYEKDVAAWNARGGAPAHVVERLRLRRAELDSMALQLNVFISQLKPKASYLNAESASLREKLGKPFDRGDFTGGRIDVYQFDDSADLATILAHELGHALFVKHVPNPAAIMYYSRTAQNSRELRLSDDDRKALTLACDQATVFDPRLPPFWRRKRM